MEETKWNYKLLGHYFRMTLDGYFIILGNRKGQWKIIIKFNNNNKRKRIKCWLFGHRINRFMIERSKKKNCLRCGKEIYDWGAYTIDDYDIDKSRYI
jgi:hypothetical protein